MENIFEEQGASVLLNRIDNLSVHSQGQWGKMSVAQMLAHCNVSFELVYEDKHPKPGKLAKFLLKLFVKKAVVGPKPYPKNGKTAPAFIISDEKDFEKEKERLKQYINKTKSLGTEYFKDKEYHSFGLLTLEEWNTMFSKHLDHHLTQFGV